MLVTTQEMIDVDVLSALVGSPQSRTADFATMARTILSAAQTQNRNAVGFVPDHVTVVDGVVGASEDAVKPDNGEIKYQFQLIWDVFKFIADTLDENSPVGSGKDPHPGLYKGSHKFFADGVECDPANPPQASEYIFLNTQDYAAKIERGSSSQFPSGVYQVTAALAASRYGNQAKIEFNYRALLGDVAVSAPPAQGTRAALAANKGAVRHPAIVVTPR